MRQNMSNPTLATLPGLLGAEQVARAAKLEVERRDLEAAAELRVPLEGLDARARVVGQRVGGRDDEVAVRALLAAADAAAELVELREPEEVGAIDDHRVRARDVEAALDDRGRHEDVVAAVDEVEHRLLERRLAHLAVRDGDARRGHELLQVLRLLVEPVDAVVDVEALAAARELARHRLADDLVVPPRDDGAHGAAIDRRRRDEREIAQAGDGHLQRARDGRRGQRQDVDLRADLLDALLVRDAEALLLVDDEQAQVLEVHVLREQAVRADDDVDLAVLEADERLLLLLLGLEARERPDLVIG